jgi:hypothetical protein
MIDWQLLLDPNPLNQFIWLAVAFAVIVTGTVGVSALGLWWMGEVE